MKNCLLIFLSFFFLVSCETVIDVDIPAYTPGIVVNGVLEEGEPVSVSITQSVGILDTAYTRVITGADVKLYENDVFVGILLMTWVDLGGDSIPGNYVIQHNAIAGAAYRIEVAAATYEPVQATATIPQAVPIVSHVYTENAYTDPDGNPVSQLSVTINDPEGTDNYYYLAIVDTTPATFESYYYLKSIDPAAVEGYTGGSILFSDELFNGKSYTLKADVSGGIPPFGSLKVVLKTIDRNYFLYEKTYYLHTQNADNPFAEPVQVFTNVEGGLGIFGGFSVDSKPLY